MLARYIFPIALSLCVILFPQIVRADEAEAVIVSLEARLIYESASKLLSEENYDRAFARLEYIRKEYPNSEYAALAGREIDEIGTLKWHPGRIGGLSRTSLVGFGTLFSTWLGVGSLIIVEVKDPTVYGLVFIAGPLGGLINSLSLTRDLKMSEGQASLINLGGAWGIWQATGAAVIADVDGKVAVGASMAGGLIGLALSTSIVRNRYVSPGDATMINFGGIWGTWLAICGSMVADVEDEDTILTAAMLGGDTGLLTMAGLAPGWKVSKARARLINVGGIVGTLYGFGTSILLNIDTGRNRWGTMGIGSLLGLAAGAYLTRHYDTEKGYFTTYRRPDAVLGSTALMRNRAGSISHSVGGDLRVPLFGARF